MDGQRFDRWARALAAASSRRGLIKGLAGTLVAGLIAADAEEAEAAARCRGCGPCQRCRNGTCVPRRDGTLCGQCGKCAAGVCVANPARCGKCRVCNESTFACNAQDCGDCGVCVNDVCKPKSGREGQDCGGSSCKVCDNGQCVAKPQNAECPGGLCCDGVCRAGAACCDDGGCPECGKCVNFACDRTAKNGQTCGTTPSCHICDNGECVALGDGFACKGVIGTCCAGVCCIGDQVCCNGQCCDGTCIAGCCIGGSSVSAADTDLCCPFGPPCGEGSNARCCNQDQECCQGECKAPEACCPEESVCGDACCSQEVLEVCTRDGCCAFERGEVACGPGSDPINDSLCCGSDEQCCPFGGEEFACCPESDVCCFGDCCPEGSRCIGDCFHQTGRGCCPGNYPEGGCDACVAANPGRTNTR
jgi:hypothetical protein